MCGLNEDVDRSLHQTVCCKGPWPCQRSGRSNRRDKWRVCSVINSRVKTECQIRQLCPWSGEDVLRTNPYILLSPVLFWVEPTGQRETRRCCQRDHWRLLSTSCLRFWPVVHKTVSPDRGTAVQPQDYPPNLLHQLPPASVSTSHLTRHHIRHCRFRYLLVKVSKPPRSSV